jgi:hypothetical protein
MISVTRLDGAEIILNADLVESIEPTPDTLAGPVVRPSANPQGGAA